METALLDLAIRAMTWIVTAVVVQADHPSDDRAFWRTRPLARTPSPSPSSPSSA